MTNLRFYFKVLKKHIPQAIIYIFFFAIIEATSIQGDWAKSEVTNQCTVYWVSEEDTPIVRSIRQQLEQQKNIFIMDFKCKQKFKSAEKREAEISKLIDEAVLVEVADVAVRIPKGFEESLSQEKPLQVEITSVKNTPNVLSVQSIINDCINRQEKQENRDNALTKMGSLNAGDYKHKAISREERVEKSTRRYFNLMVYGLTAVIIVGIVSVAASINADEVKTRRKCAPMDGQEESTILTGHFIFGILTLALFILPSFAVGRGYMFTGIGAMFIINSVILAGNLILIAYMLSLFTKKIEMQLIVTNIISLAALFISGTVQEQWEQSDVTAQIGQFMPTYWYVKTNNLIANIPLAGEQGLKGVIENMGIQILFFIALVIGILVIKKQEKILEEEGR